MFIKVCEFSPSAESLFKFFQIYHPDNSYPISPTYTILIVHIVDCVDSQALLQIQLLFLYNKHNKHHLSSAGLSMMYSENEISKLDPTLRMDVMSPGIVCQAGMKRVRCRQVAGKYACNYKKVQLKHLRACKDVCAVVRLQENTPATTKRRS